uniref:DDE Tnp4 domain-containing protein n=1 Tax=Parascaris equorum TaxID=6256 RepID=A0A914R8S3_PAREQ
MQRFLGGIFPAALADDTGYGLNEVVVDIFQLGARKHTALLRMNEVRASIHRGIRAVDELLIECQNALNADDLIPDISEHNTEVRFANLFFSKEAKILAHVK